MQLQIIHYKSIYKTFHTQLRPLCSLLLFSFSSTDIEIFYYFRVPTKHQIKTIDHITMQLSTILFILLPAGLPLVTADQPAPTINCSQCPIVNNLSKNTLVSNCQWNVPICYCANGGIPCKMGQ